jgi:hypothetical protein
VIQIWGANYNKRFSRTLSIQPKVQIREFRFSYEFNCREGDFQVCCCKIDVESEKQMIGMSLFAKLGMVPMSHQL